MEGWAAIPVSPDPTLWGPQIDLNEKVQHIHGYQVTNQIKVLTARGAEGTECI